MVSDISLDASIRSNLLALKGTQRLLDAAQNRVATGLKVNTAADNPLAYFATQDLSRRAVDLENLLGAMTQSIQTLKAADEGISTITKMVEQAKTIVSQYTETSDAARQATLDAQYRSLITQINNLAEDISYRGVNLLQGDDMTVYLNENTRAGAAANIAVLGITLSATAPVSGTGGLGLAAGIAADPVAAMNGAISALNVLRGVASDLEGAYSVIRDREAFTGSMIDILSEGADSLVVADINEESADLLAIQTRQLLAINSLSLAAQARQALLQLFY